MSDSISPYDIPEAVRAFKDGQRLIVEFKYATEETYRSVHKGNITLKVGRNSGRLYRIEVDVKGKAENFRIAVSEAGIAIEGLATDRSRVKRSGNYGLAKRLISTENDSSPFVNGVLRFAL